jgi:hypothetical protein
MTFPINKGQTIGAESRATLNKNGITFLKEAVYHGNPIDPNGSLVTIDYGYDIHSEITSWTNFDVEIILYGNDNLSLLIRTNKHDELVKVINKFFSSIFLMLPLPKFFDDILFYLFFYK